MKALACRALQDEGVAADLLFELIAGHRGLTGEERIKTWAACAWLARTGAALRGQ